jgi:NADH:ubiquinone oxidoreductase subunit 6 (subunit J)
MNFELNLFYIFASLTIISAIMVIRVKNPVHSVLFLILVFCNAAGLLILLEVDFLAMIFLVVYVGAIAVLFLFVVMMLNIKINNIQGNFIKYLPIGGIIGIIFLLEIFLVLESDLIPLLQTSNNLEHTDWYALLNNNTNIETFGQLLYTYYFYYFLIAGIILLVAMIGAIVLTLKTNNFVYRQQIYQQVSRNFNNAIFLVNPTSDKDRKNIK